MRFLKHVALAALVSPFAQTLVAQAPPASATLTLDEAIAVARRNNPTFLQTANTRRIADAEVRSAYGALLPQSNASFQTRFQQGGQQVFNGLSFQSSSDVRQSGYNLSLNYQINSATLIAPKAARASREATNADITGAAEMLRATVTQQYITVLQAQARAALADTLVNTARGQLELAQARTSVGAGTVLDVRRAEVALGQAQVQALTAHNTAEVEKLRLFQQMGVPQPETVQLTTAFPVAKPSFALDSLLEMARRQNPNLVALREREKSSSLNVRVAQSSYTPTLSVSTGWGGQSYEYTDPSFLVTQKEQNILNSRASCYFQDTLRTRIGLSSVAGECAKLVFTPEMARTIRSNNNQFPFRFTRSPFSVFAQLSIPVFDSFNREQRVEQAAVARDNARYVTRARELQTTADVTQAYLNVTTAARTVELQEVNAARAREELAFAEERYRVGAATFLDVTTSRGTFEQAQIDRVNAIYDYHRAFAALESAVGRPLR